jgi:hypothetical protein
MNRSIVFGGNGMDRFIRAIAETESLTDAASVLHEFVEFGGGEWDG